jgi:hypothetical protein
MSRFLEVQEENKRRRERILEGKFNCLPFPFVRFRKKYPGVEQGKLIIISANQKVGKSKLADYLFIYEPLFYMIEHPELKVKVLYFSLEMSAKEKYNEFLCHLLWRLDGIHIDTRRLRSVDEPCDEKILQLLESEKYQKYIQAYENMVIFNDTDKNPTGIKIFCWEYAKKHGKFNYITVETENPITGEKEERKVYDPIKPYTQDDEEEYRFIIMDNAANVVVEKGLKDQREAIERVSKDGIELKKKLNYIYVLIQHQAQATEGLEAIKMDMMIPSAAGLGNNKETSRDVNCLMGLYNPEKYGKKEYLGYNLTKLKNFCRFLVISEDRDYGAGGSICPLFFDGAVSAFAELPLPNDTAELERVYQYINKINSKNTLLFMHNKKSSKRFAKRKRKKYLCSPFNKSRS